MAGGAALGGGIIGAVLGTVGGAIEAYQQRAEQSSLRRRFREGVRKGTAATEKEVYDVLNSPEFQTVRSFSLGTFGVANPGNAAGAGGPTSFAGKDFLAAPTGRATSKGDRRNAIGLAKTLDEYLTAQSALSSGVDRSGRPLTDSARASYEQLVRSDTARNAVLAIDSLDAGGQNAFAAEFGKTGRNIKDYTQLSGALLGRPTAAAQTLDNGGGIVETPLTRAFRSQIAQTQVQRGIYDSQAAAAAEASGLAAYQYEQQQRMLPFLLQQSTFGNDIYHKYESANIGREVQKATGGVGVYGAANPFVGAPSVVGNAFNAGVSGAFSGAALGVQLQSAFGGGGGQAPVDPLASFRTERGGLGQLPSQYRRLF